MPPFGIFKKKERRDDYDNGGDSLRLPQQQHHYKLPSADIISIPEAQELLRNIESAKVQELSTRLIPIRESATSLLAYIERLADQMNNEKIKLEGLEQKFKSTVENSKRTVVSSLRREASSQLPMPKSINDTKRFKEKLESVMNRFGEVSGSHSKMLNVFMKKYAGKMKEEFAKLSDLLSETKSLMSEFEQQRAPVVKCSNILNTASQKASSVRMAEESIKRLEKEIENVQGELARLDSELAALKGSAEFNQAASVAQKISELEKKEEQFRTEVLDLFSHVSRAFTKYSYGGMTKDTEARLQVLSEEPWKILLYERQADDSGGSSDDKSSSSSNNDDDNSILPYSSLLLEIRKSVDSGSIQLKDADKVLHYLDIILHSLPQLQKRAQALKAEIDLLRRGYDNKIISRAGELEEKIGHYREELARSNQAIEQQRRQITEKHSEVEGLLREASNILFDLTGKKYSIQY